MVKEEADELPILRGMPSVNIEKQPESARMRWLEVGARAATALIAALIVCFVSTLLSHSTLPPFGGGPKTIWVPASVTFLVAFFGIPLLAKFGNLNRKPGISSPQDKYLLVLLILIAVVVTVILVPSIFQVTKL